MAEVTTHQRMNRMYAHREADRVPVTDSPWGATIQRWRREGLPEGVTCREFFGLDHFVGLNAVLYNDPDRLWEEMARVIPVMKQDGGYLISSDHSVPHTVSLDQFRRFVALAKELGSYD